MDYIARNRVPSMKGKVQELGTTQKGSPKVKIDGEWLYPGRCPIQGMSVGMMVEYFTSPFQAGNKTLLGLESWAPAKEGVTHTPSPSGAAAVQERAAPEYTEAEMRFISNCVGSAITAGACKAPADIAQWFRSARAAVKADYFDDDSTIP